MKILFITDFLPPFINGISTYSENTIRCLKNAGHEVTTFGPKGSSTADYHLPTIDLHPTIETNLCFPNGKLLKCVLKNHYDIIHINCPQGLSGWLICPLAKKKKTRVVYFNHGNITAWFQYNVDSVFARKIFTKLLIGFYYLSQKLFSPLVVQNPGSEDLALHFKKKIPTLEGACGVNVQVFKFSPTYDKYHLVAVGRLSKEKNWEQLIFLFSHLPPHYKLTLIGIGKQQKKLKKQAHKLGLQNITFIGKIAPNALGEYLQKAQACITASLFETWGLTLIEGLACGTPPVYPNHHPFIDLYTESFPKGSYDVNDPNTFVEAVMQTETTNSEDRKKCRAFSEKFTWERATEKLLEAYRS